MDDEGQPTVTLEHTLEADTALNNEQLARVEALGAARAALSETHGIIGGIAEASRLPKRVTVPDLIDVAEWIVNGTDPMAAYRDEVTAAGLSFAEREV